MSADLSEAASKSQAESASLEASSSRLEASVSFAEGTQSQYSAESGTEFSGTEHTGSEYSIGTGGTSQSQSQYSESKSEVTDGSGSKTEGGGSLETKEEESKSTIVEMNEESDTKKTNKDRHREAVTDRDVDLIIASRVKKYSIETPYIEAENGCLMKIAYVEHPEFEHLMMEVTEGEFKEFTARPDLEMHVVGCQAKTETKAIVERRLKKAKTQRLATEKAAAKAAAEDGKRATTPSKNKKGKKEKEKKKGKSAAELLEAYPVWDTTDGKGVIVFFDSVRQTYVDM